MSEDTDAPTTDGATEHATSHAAALDTDYETIRLERDRDRIVTIVIDRPDARNALNEQVRAELERLLPAVAAAPERVLVITGSAACNAFVAGADVRELRERGVLEQRRASERPRVFERVAELDMPVIARLNGHTLGGGMELALACDVRVAARGGKFGQPEINLGIIPGGGATQRLPRLIGEGQAMRLILSGELLDADAAAELGLVDLVSDPDGLDEAAYGLAERMATKSPVALAAAKEAIRAAGRMDVDAGLDYEAELFAGLFATHDKNEGIDAFLEDREPSFEGR